VRTPAPTPHPHPHPAPPPRTPRLPWTLRSGLPSLILENINKCDVDVRKDLFGGMLLAGGGSLFGSLRERLEARPCLLFFMLNCLFAAEQKHLCGFKYRSKSIIEGSNQALSGANCLK